MNRIAAILFLLFCLPGIRETCCFAQALSSSELIRDSKEHDGRAVVYAGEVIGDIMHRGAFAWINVSDGANAIGVWASEDLITGIKTGGDFKHTGDRVVVRGVLNRACIEHGGDLDIHAAGVSLEETAVSREHVFEKNKKEWAVKFLGALAVIWILTLLKTR